jgi:hypothetical protein
MSLWARVVSPIIGAIMLSFVWRVSSLLYLQKVGCAVAKAKVERCGSRELSGIPLDRSPEDDELDEVVNSRLKLSL